MTTHLTDHWAASFPAEHADPYCIAPSEARRLLAAAPWRRIVAIGDSVAAGVREPSAGYEDLGGFDRVARVLPTKSDHAYQNLGERGLRIREVIDRQLEPALGTRADLALVAVGGNDALSRGFDPDQVRDDLAHLISALTQTGTTVAVIGLFDLARSGLLPPDVAGPMAARFDELDRVTSVAAQGAGAVFVDNHTHPLARNRHIFASDLMHCNARGHAVSAATLTTALAAAAAQNDSSIPFDERSIVR